MLRFIREKRKPMMRLSLFFALIMLMSAVFSTVVGATEASTASGDNLISIGISAGDGSDLASVLQMLLVLTVISVAPSILIMLTSFTRIVIVLHFTRAAIGTQTVPPNQIIIGLSLFLT